MIKSNLFFKSLVKITYWQVILRIIYFKFLEITNSYVVDTTGLYLDMCPGGDLTFSVPKDYIQELAKQKNSFALIHHYLLLCSTINVKGKRFGMMAQEWFAEKLGVKEVKTIRTRHQLFEALDLIKFSEHRNTTNKNGEFVNIPKLYTMPYNAKEIEELANEQLKKSVSSANKAIREAKKQAKQQEKNTAPKKSENPFGNRNPFGNSEDLKSDNSTESDKSKDAELEDILSSEPITIKKSIGRR